MGKSRGVDFDTRQSAFRQQLNRRWRSKQSVRFAAVNHELKAILLLLHEDDAEHTGGSKGEGSETSLRRLTDKESIRPRTAQQPRIVVASRLSF